MTYQGTVRNGVVVLQTDSPPAEGTPVDVFVRHHPTKKNDQVETTKGGSSWVDVVLQFAGAGKGLPRDLAAEHDHYLHGTPKRSERSE